VVWKALHPSSSLIFSWIRIRKISCSCSAEGDGFLLLYKRLELGAFNWPRTKEEALEITPEQYQYLMQGLEVVARHPIQEVRPGKVL
jgi:transposase